MHLQDVGGEEKLRPYWRHYYTGTQGVVFVVDASDRERLPLAALELRSLANDEQLAVRDANAWCEPAAQSWRQGAAPTRPTASHGPRYRHGQELAAWHHADVPKDRILQHNPDFTVLPHAGCRNRRRGE